MEDVCISPLVANEFSYVFCMVCVAHLYCALITNMGCIETGRQRGEKQGNGQPGCKAQLRNVLHMAHEVGGRGAAQAGREGKVCQVNRHWILANTNGGGKCRKAQQANGEMCRERKVQQVGAISNTWQRHYRKRLGSLAD